MTLLLDHAVDAFDFGASSLVTPAGDDLDPDAGEREIPASVIGRNAAERSGLAHSDRDDWTIVPLHEPDSAQLTREYIIYTGHDLRGELFVYADGDGDTEFLPATEFRSTPLAERIRYWHADHVPSTPPVYHSSPIRSREHARNQTAVGPSSFFGSLIDRIEDERNAQREANAERARRESASEIHADGGDAIPSLRSHGQAEGSIYRFEVSTADDDETRGGYVQSTFGIYEGNEVLLSSPTPNAAPDVFPVRATVSDITGENVYLDVEREAANEPRFRHHLRGKPVGYGLVGILNPVPFDRERDAVETLDAGSPFAEVFTGDTSLTFTDSAAARTDRSDTALNQDQQSAVEHALSADRLFCIHGPPGTGKTRTLVEIIRRAARDERAVLVCADSNRAVDNIIAGTSTPSRADEGSLHAYAQHGADEFTLRRNNIARSSNDLIRDAYGDGAGGADVVASTNGSAATVDRTFDLVVVDEATQATLTSTCIPLARARRAILAGDHRQLPPYSASEEPPAETPSSGTGASLFEHLYSDGGVYDGVGIALRTQYRMHRDIARFPNRRFYDNILESGRVVDAVADRPAIVGYDIGGSETTSGTSTANPTEARLVAHLAGDLLDADDIADEDIGIITPYTAQKSAIEDVLPGRADAVTVDTIDAFQGSEKAAVLISLVRSNADGRVGFLGRPEDGPRRLNVAITRAERFCGIIGDWRTLTRERDGADKCTDLYRSLHSHLDDTGCFRHVEPELLP